MSKCFDCEKEAGEFARCAECRANKATYKNSWYAKNCERARLESNARYAELNGGIVSKDCENCGDTYSGIARGMKRRRFCSRPCKIDARWARIRAERLAGKLNLVRNCPHCGSALDNSMRSDAVYCSESCNSAAHNATRKAKMKILVDGVVERIPRAYIIERDASRCHMCRKKCRQDEIHLDHVIPLARGGAHTLENLRVACATCNLSKGARERCEQLMLVG